MNAVLPIEYQILTGVEKVLQRIKVADGYWNDLANTSIHRQHLNINFEEPCQDPSSYPHVIISPGGVELSQRIGHRKDGVMTFPIQVYVYDEVEVDKALHTMLKDIERAIEFENNESFPLMNHIIACETGSVRNMRVTAWTTDEGFLAPWAYSVLRVRVEYTYIPDLQKP